MRARASALGSWRWPLGASMTVMLVATAMVLGAFAQRLPCLQSTRDSQGQIALDWSNGRPFTDYCYTDVVALYLADQLDRPGEFPYRTSWVENAGTPFAQLHYVEYPVLTGLLMWAGAQIAQGVSGAGLFPDVATVVVFFGVLALVLGGAWLFVVRAVMALSRREPRHALFVALSPLVIAQLFTNFDAVAVAFATGGLLAWARRRPGLAGVLLGLGGAAKAYPVLLLIPLLVLCARAGTLRAGGRAVVGALVSWALVNDPIAILYPRGWAYFWRFSAMRGAGFESLYHIVAYFTGVGVDQRLAFNQSPLALNALSAGLFVAACLAICWMALSAPRRPRLAPLCLLVVAAFLLLGKVYSPQYSLWLVPLAALSLPRWRLLVPWMIIDALVWVPTLLFQRAAIGQGYFLGAILVRDAAIAVICAVVIRDVYRPQHDVLRRAGDDDPCGGVFDGAPDHFTIGRRRLAVAR